MRKIKVKNYVAESLSDRRFRHRVLKSKKKPTRARLKTQLKKNGDE